MWRVKRLDDAVRRLARRSFVLLHQALEPCLLTGDHEVEAEAGTSMDQRIGFAAAGGGPPLAYAVCGHGPFLIAPPGWVSQLELTWALPPERRFWEAPEIHGRWDPMVVSCHRLRAGPAFRLRSHLRPPP